MFQSLVKGLVVELLVNRPPHHRAPLHAGRQLNCMAVVLFAHLSPSALKHEALEEPRKQFVGL